MVPQMGDRCLTSIRKRKAGREHIHARDDQPDNGDDLDEGKPEFDFTEIAHGRQIERQKREDQSERRYPERQFREPERDVARNGNHVGHTGHNPAKPIGPAGEELCPRPEVIACEIRKGAIFEIGQQDFAQCAHDEEQHEADHGINQQDRRACQRNGLARTHEKAGADSAANGDQLQVSVGQIACKMGFLLPMWIDRRL